MARPLKSGVDYWGFDCGFFDDKKVKLIRSEFGIKGEYIAIRLINYTYKENGYYKKWDEEDCLLMSSELGGVDGGITPEFIGEVVKGCVRRSLFDERVYNVFGVLTSPGIQRRFVRMVANNREKITIIEEYWLLDNADERDVPSGTLCKLDLKSITNTENSIIHTENEINLTDNTQRKRKGKEIKANEMEVKEKEASAPTSGETILLHFADGFFPLPFAKRQEYKDRYTCIDVDAEFFKMKSYLESKKHDKKLKDAAKFINGWLKGTNDESLKKKNSEPKEKSYDINEFFKVAVNHSMGGGK